MSMFPRRQVKNPKFPCASVAHKMGGMYYGYRLGSKSDGFYGRLVEHYYTLNNPYRSDGLLGDFTGYRNYAWVLEDPETGKRLSFQNINSKPPRTVRWWWR